MEVKLDRPLNGEIELLADVITAEQSADDVIRYRTADPAATNPRLVQRLTQLGLGVVSLQPLPQSLEDVYLSVVGALPPGGVMATQRVQALP